MSATFGAVAYLLFEGGLDAICPGSHWTRTVLRRGDVAQKLCHLGDYLSTGGSKWALDPM
jgi:hypothetical protein